MVDFKNTKFTTAASRKLPEYKKNKGLKNLIDFPKFYKQMAEKFEDDSDIKYILKTLLSSIKTAIIDLTDVDTFYIGDMHHLNPPVHDDNTMYIRLCRLKCIAHVLKDEFYKRNGTVLDLKYCICNFHLLINENYYEQLILANTQLTDRTMRAWKATNDASCINNSIYVLLMLSEISGISLETILEDIPAYIPNIEVQQMVSDVKSGCNAVLYTLQNAPDIADILAMLETYANTGDIEAQEFYNKVETLNSQLVNSKAILIKQMQDVLSALEKAENAEEETTINTIVPYLELAFANIESTLSSLSKTVPGVGEVKKH